MDDLTKKSDNKLKVLFVTPWNVACGIATYSSNLVEQLEKLGVQVEIFSETKNFNSMVKLAKDSDADLVHIQHEFGISIATEALLSLCGKFRTAGKPVVLTAHTEDDILNVLMDGSADAVILHNDEKDMASKPTFSKFYKIPHGIPEISFEHDKAYYRKKYGIPEDAFVIGTCGFMSPQRGQFIEDFLGYLVKFIKENKDIYIHLATSSHRADGEGGYAKMMSSSITNMATENGFADRMHIHEEFMDNDEFRERLYTFDLGFAHTELKIASNSGAAADMVSCNVPVIVNNVPHFSHIAPYALVVEDIHEMVQTFMNTYALSRSEGLDALVELTKKAVEDLGYSKVAKKHLEIYKTAIESKMGVKKDGATILSKERVLNTDEFINITCPNSLWQLMLLYPKLAPLIKKGHTIRFIVQNDGPMETAILPFILEGIGDIQYADVGMDSDPRTARLYSKSLAQNMTTDVERWLKDGHDYDELFEFMGPMGPDNRFEFKLGDFAVKRAEKIIPYPTDVAVINVNDDKMLLRAIPILQHMTRAHQVNFEKLVVMGKPTSEQYARALYEKVEGSVYDGACVVIEDTRTRWALCSRIAGHGGMVITGWDDIAAYCAINRIHTKYDYDITVDWQKRFVKNHTPKGMQEYSVKRDCCI